jgi:hypothetical protein
MYNSACTDALHPAHNKASVQRDASHTAYNVCIDAILLAYDSVCRNASHVGIMIIHASDIIEHERCLSSCL